MSAHLLSLLFSLLLSDEWRARAGCRCARSLLPGSRSASVIGQPGQVERVEGCNDLALPKSFTRRARGRGTFSGGMTGGGSCCEGATRPFVFPLVAAATGSTVFSCRVRRKRRHASFSAPRALSLPSRASAGSAKWAAECVTRRVGRDGSRRRTGIRLRRRRTE